MARRRAFEPKDIIGGHLKREEMHISGRACFVAAQASPEKRELFGYAGRFTSALQRVAPDESLTTKREYSGRGITVLAWRGASADKNHHLEASVGGRWIRIAEWVKQSGWKLFESDLKSIGVDRDRLLKAISEEE